MSSRALRRLAADHAALHHQQLPPNYLFAPSAAHSDDLTQLDILLAGPTHTPFAAGLWKLHLTIPANYPQEPPTANFRTPIFHPNVDPVTGGVCVETLKRDWRSELTLRDVLITISCLLVQPNPDSALNAEAGTLLREDYNTFARRAELMCSIHAQVPRALHVAAKEAQNRGQEQAVEDDEGEQEKSAVSAGPVTRRRTVAMVRASKRVDQGSRERAVEQQPPPQAPVGRPFVFQAGNDDVFGVTPTHGNEEVDTEMQEGDQENDSAWSAPKASDTPATAMTPRRPHGVAVPLGELIMEQEESSSDAEPEYPPSPRKSPSKSPPKRRKVKTYDPIQNMDRGESSRHAALRLRNITPANHDDRPLLDNESSLMDVTFENSLSPRKTRRGLFDTPPKRPKPAQDIFGSAASVFTTSWQQNDIVESSPLSIADSKTEAQRKRKAANDELWLLCGGDIRRWNRGDFDGEPFRRKAARW